MERVSDLDGEGCFRRTLEVSEYRGSMEKTKETAKMCALPPSSLSFFLAMPENDTAARSKGDKKTAASLASSTSIGELCKQASEQASKRASERAKVI